MKNLLKLIGAIGVFSFGTTANAALLTYTLTDSNEDVMDGTVWAVVQIQDSGISSDATDNVDLDATGAIEVRVSTTDAFAELSNFGMQTFSFNYDMTVLGTDPIVTLDASNIAIDALDPSTWDADLDPKKSTSVFGKFDIALAGDGGDRTDALAFLITGVDGDVADNYAVYFATHIASFDGYEDFDSAYFGGAGSGDRGLEPPAVPIPPAAWLFASGIIGLVGVARRSPIA
jgi:hypothetical protein